MKCVYQPCDNPKEVSVPKNGNMSVQNQMHKECWNEYKKWINSTQLKEKS